MKSLIIGLVAGVTLSASADARERGITYDCDTAANHYSELTLPTATAFEASGKVRLMSMAKSKEYATLARVLVTNQPDEPGPSDEGWAGFTFMNLAGQKNPVPGILLATRRAKGAKANEDTLGIASGAEVAFTLRYDGEQVSLEIDGHSTSVPLSAQRPALRIVCSTGEFLFHDLVITETP